MEFKNNIKKYKYTNTICYSCQYHIIWTTKFRRKVLDEKIQKRLKELIYSKENEYSFKIIELETMEDHIHLLLDINPYIGVYKVISLLKGYTSKTLREEFKSLKSRLPTLWTRSKFISTCGSVSLEVVKKYIENQKGV